MAINPSDLTVANPFDAVFDTSGPTPVQADPSLVAAAQPVGVPPVDAAATNDPNGLRAASAYFKAGGVIPTTDREFTKLLADHPELSPFLTSVGIQKDVANLGPQLKARVTALQSSLGFQKPDGKFGAKTFEAMARAQIGKGIRPGVSHKPTNGSYGELDPLLDHVLSAYPGTTTEDRVKAFQTQQGLDPDGKVGVKTTAAIRTLPYSATTAPAVDPAAVVRPADTTVVQPTDTTVGRVPVDPFSIQPVDAKPAKAVADPVAVVVPGKAVKAAEPF